MKKTFFWLTSIIAFLLPLHGGITVFLPEGFRWWKELLLVFLAVVLFVFEIQTIQKNGIKKWLKTFARIDVLALLFLAVGDVLFLFHPEKLYAIYALRYLLLPTLVWWVVFRVNKNFKPAFVQKNIQNFAKCLVAGLLVSVLFALLFQQLQISGAITAFYSNVVSSWVPGQTLQKWHEVGALVRWQGLSSGPIAFSHLLVLGLAVLPVIKTKKYLKIIFKIVLATGIIFSFSRSAFFAMLLVLVLQNFDLKKIYKEYQKIVIGFGVLVLLAVTAFGVKTMQRSGTIDHFTRPIEALGIGFTNTFSGNLAQLGPAARMKNMAQNNNDQALIAENVLVDVFAQMGLFGILFFVLWLLALHKIVQKKQRPVLYSLFVMMNLATIFDMTPITIAYFWWLGILRK